MRGTKSTKSFGGSPDTADSADSADSPAPGHHSTTARSFAATVDALGKVATMLGVPADELWERIPAVSQQDVERWRARARQRAAAAAGIGDVVPAGPTNGTGAAA